MGALIGFGSPFVTLVWALITIAILGWVGRQLLQQRLFTLLSLLVIFSFFLPIVLQYPFTFSPINGLTIGPENYARYRSHVDAAFLITSLGMAMLFTGYAACGRSKADFVPVRLVASGLRVWTQSVFLQLSSVFILLLFGLLLAGGILGAGGARNLAQSSPALRPIYNIAHILLPLIIGLALFVGIERRRRGILLLVVINLGLAVLTGARTVALGGIMLYVMARLIHTSLLRRLSVATALKLIPIGVALLIAAVYLGDVREGQYNIFQTIATLGVKLFYGNNYSDLRDFAWVRSYWNGDYYLGRTQMAGFLAFIPSAVSSFRSEWNWGVVTTRMVGLDPTVSPGLRAGTFGEMYFNFGLIGVVVAGLLYGYVIRRIHNSMLADAHRLPAPQARLQVLAGQLTAGLFAGFLNTAGFFGFYVTLAVLAGLHTLDYVLRATRSGSPSGFIPPPLRDPSPS